MEGMMWKGSYIRSSVQPDFGETAFQVTSDSTKLEVSESSCVVQTERATALYERTLWGKRLSTFSFTKPEAFVTPCGDRWGK